MNDSSNREASGFMGGAGMPRGIRANYPPLGSDDTVQRPLAAPRGRAQVLSRKRETVTPSLVSPKSVEGPLPLRASYHDNRHLSNGGLIRAGSQITALH